jgi:hypothetical protein
LMWREHHSERSATTGLDVGSGCSKDCVALVVSALRAASFGIDVAENDLRAVVNHWIGCGG